MGLNRFVRVASRMEHVALGRMRVMGGLLVRSCFVVLCRFSMVPFSMGKMF
jgi:hypothetical protein